MNNRVMLDVLFSLTIAHCLLPMCAVNGMPSTGGANDGGGGGVASNRQVEELDMSITRELADSGCINKSDVQSNQGDSSNQALSGVDRSTICKGVEWNSTYRTNLLGYETNSPSTIFWMGNFQPLIKLKCSANTERFLCSLALPICYNRDQANPASSSAKKKSFIIPPCFELCEQVRLGCESSMNAYGFPWPYPCGTFPANNSTTKAMCVPPNIVEYTQSGVINSKKDPLDRGNPDNDPNESDKSANSFLCPHQLSTREKLGYSFLGAKDCSAPCKETLLSGGDYQVARYWIAGWSLICFISSLFTSFTYLVDRRRFKYPEKPIIYLSSCYVFISITFLVGFSAQNTISCSTDYNLHKLSSSTTSSFTQTGYGQGGSSWNPPLVTQGIQHVGCTISFIFLYYFLMASSLWWVVLSFTWLLAAGLKWSHEAIEQKALVFHACAWVVPLILVVTVLFSGGVEGDDISGTCFTGMLNPNFTLYFVLLPLVVSLSLGFTFLVFGFVSLCRVRHFIKMNGDRTDKLEKLMIRIGVFSLFYMVPAIILISCFIYEYRYKLTWHRQWWQSKCTALPSSSAVYNCAAGTFQQDPTSISQIKSRRYSPSSSSEAEQPNFYVFLLRYFVTLAVGVTSSFWLWSKKTLDSWRNVLCLNSVVGGGGSNNPLMGANGQQLGLVMSKKGATAMNVGGGAVTMNNHGGATTTAGGTYQVNNSATVHGGGGTGGVTSIVAPSANHGSGMAPPTGRKNTGAHFSNVSGAAFV